MTRAASLASLTYFEARLTEPPSLSNFGTISLDGPMKPLGHGNVLLFRGSIC